MIHRIVKLRVPFGTYFRVEIKSDLSDLEGIWLHQINSGLNHCLESITNTFYPELKKGQNHILLPLVVNEETKIIFNWQLEIPKGTIRKKNKPKPIDLSRGEHILIWYFGVG